MWIWDCMVVAFQSVVGGFFWSLLFVIIGVIAFGIHEVSLKRKPTYKGKPIVFNGGKNGGKNE